MRRHIIALLLTAAVGAPSNAQYFDNQVLEKGFERTDFFFTPSYLNPYGLEGFGPVVSGLVIDPLLDIQLSPSLARTDSTRGTSIYLDFRSTREQSDYQDYPIFLEGDYRGIGLPYYSAPSYRPAEPVLSAAVFFRPSQKLAGLVVGATYRVLADNQSYYAVPQNIYRSSPGLDFSGEAVGNGSVPIIDVYGGSDRMNQVGHFPSLFAAYQITPEWRAGVRAAFARFDRDGESGSSYNQQPFENSNTSVSSQFQGRSQSYRHLDLSIGIDGLLSSSTAAGGSVGRLTGDADQVRESTNRYISRYGSATGAIIGDGSDYRSGGFSDAGWTQTGGSVYGTLFVRRQMDQSKVITIAYRGSREGVDLDSWSSIADSSFSSSFSRNTDYSYDYEYRSRLGDERMGTGRRTGTSHRLSLGLNWTMTPSSRLTFGLVGLQQVRDTETVDDVESRRYRFVDNTWPQGSEFVEQDLSEVKALTWTFSSRQSSLRVPIMLWQRLSDHFELLLGVSREMEDSRFSEQTVALIEERIDVRNGVRTEKGDFAERYREPTEYRTAVSTTGIFGITASPSPNFDVRLLVSPRWSNAYNSRRTQWWLGFQFKP
jgi:hypothetical protein